MRIKLCHDLLCVQKGVREKNCFREHDFLFGFPF